VNLAPPTLNPVAIRRAIEAQLAEEDMAIASAANKAADIDDDGYDPETRTRIPPEKPAGMSARDFRIARDARKSTKDAPVYLKLASERAAARSRLEAAASSGQSQINILIQLPPLESDEEAAQRPVIDVEVEPKK